MVWNYAGFPGYIWQQTQIVTLIQGVFFTECLADCLVLITHGTSISVLPLRVRWQAAPHTGFDYCIFKWMFQWITYCQCAPHTVWCNLVSLHGCCIYLLGTAHIALSGESTTNGIKCQVIDIANSSKALFRLFRLFAQYQLPVQVIFVLVSCCQMLVFVTSKLFRLWGQVWLQQRGILKGDGTEGKPNLLRIMRSDVTEQQPRTSLLR